MHRSRLSTLLLDAPEHQAAESAAFWSAALGVDSSHPQGEPPFTSQHGVVPGLDVAVQAVDDQPRFHVDLETDDVPPECVRLEALGAVEVATWLECHTFRAPGGHLLCVIPLHSDPGTFAALARTWP